MLTLAAGFADPVIEGQTAFRAAMDALARPCRPVQLTARLAPPAPLSPEAGALVLALVDFETPFFVDAPGDAGEAIRGFIRFHTGAKAVNTPREAAFAIITAPLAMPALAAFEPGTLAFPDRSATLIVQVQSLSAPGPVVARGPGIEDAVAFGAAPLAEGFVAGWKANAKRFPCGVDVLFAAPGAVAGLPRTTTLEG